MTSAHPVDPPPPAASVPCRLSVPDGFEPPVRYAIEELLRPLGLSPDWNPPDSAPAGLRYGLSDGPTPDGWVTIPMSGTAADWLAKPSTVPVGKVRWRDVEGRKIPVLFMDGDDPDPVANAFFWLSGFQERLSGSCDRHGRFTGGQSLQAALGISEDAPVDDMRELLAARLADAGVRLHRRRWKGRSWTLCPTFDVDYMRKWRPGILWRESVQNLLLGYRGDSAGRRLRRFGRVLEDLVRPRDPFHRAMDRIAVELGRVRATSTWFFKAGAHGPHDVGYRLEAGRVRARLSGLLDAGHEIGLHPSYHAFAHTAYMGTECARLERAAGNRPAAVRMHYLRWQEPDTPRLVERLGMRIDSTLGFPDETGFRRGTTMPFRVWDHVAGRGLDLWEMPLAAMESALFVRRELGVEEAVRRTDRLAETARRHGGALVALWHTTLWDELDYPGWGEHFLRTLDGAVDGGAAVSGLSDALSSWTPG